MLLPAARRLGFLLLGLACLAGCQGGGAAAVDGERQEALSHAPGHRSLRLRWDPAGLALLEQRSLPGPRQQLRVPPTGPWRVELLDASGAVRFTRHLEAPSVVRADAVLGGPPALVHRPEASFLVAVPEAPEAGSLRVWARAWTLPGAPAEPEAWVLVGTVALPGTAR